MDRSTAERGAGSVSRASWLDAGSIRLVPAYPTLLAVAFSIALFSESTAATQALVRPLLIGVLLVILAQAVASRALRSLHAGAAAVFLIELVLIGPLPWTFSAAAILAIGLGLGLAVHRQRARRPVPLDRLTHVLNVVLALTSILVLARAVAAGSLAIPGPVGTLTRDTPASALPDIYLVLLDGYPRSDTLAESFAFDNEPFLTRMSALGFETKRESRSNYNGTELTLASMMNMSQVADIPGLADRSEPPQAQSRALTRAINRGRALEVLRREGYEIVSIPSDVSSVTMYSADRVLDSGQMTSFEFEIMQQGSIPNVASDAQRSWLLGQHRDRVNATFDQLGDIAAERADHPRFVFAHVMAPHAPVVFGPAGEPRDGWPCFPVDCSIFYGGQEYGKAVLGAISDQVEYVNARVAKTASEILALSARKPVIIFFSDHGHRHDFDDQAEMLRILFISSTPDHAGLFPDDVTPVNVIPRLLNTYAGTGLEMTSEESYVVDMRTVDSTGIMAFEPWGSDR